MNKSEDLVKGATRLIDGTRRMLVENTAKAIAILTAVLAVLLSFLDITLPELSYKSLTIEVAVLLIASYIIYFSLMDAGESYGKEAEDYKRCEAEYLAVRERVGTDKIAALREFCLRYSKEELWARRRMLLVSEAISDEEYARYLKGEKLPPRERKICERASRMRAEPIDPRALLEVDGCSHGVAPTNPKRHKAIAQLIKLIPMTLCTLFTVSMMITTKDGMTLGTVLESVIKLGCLPIVALRGYISGYRYTTESLKAWYDGRRELLLEFLADEGED